MAAGQGETVPFLTAHVQRCEAAGHLEAAAQFRVMADYIGGLREPAKLVTGIYVAENIQRLKHDPVFKMVDTCAGEFESATPYYYSTFETEDDFVSMRGK